MSELLQGPGLPPGGPVPAALGFRHPAEWEPHAATWIAWPHRREDWPGKFEPIPWVFAEIVRALTRSEQVNLLIKGPFQRAAAEEALNLAGARPDRIRFVRMPTDRCWVRDSAPALLVRDPRTGEVEGEVAAVPFRFNGWAKYPEHKRDERVAAGIAAELGLTTYEPIVGKSGRFVLEGGAYDTNGLGCVMVTEECLLSPVQARNPDLTREQVERVLCDFLGVRRVIWLPAGIVGDDTHGHIDDAARFAGPRTIVAPRERDRNDPNFEPLAANWDRLRSAVDQDGHPFQLVELPMPRPILFDGERLPASYANFYIANRAVLVPTFNDPADRRALNILADLFPDREVVGIHAVDLVLGLGTIHCLTHEQPAAPVASKLKRDDPGRN